MAYFQQALATEASFIDDLRTKLKDFLDNNQWFDECLAIRLAAEVRILCLKFSLNPVKFSLTRETDQSQFEKIQLLNGKIDQNTNFAKLLFVNKF